jgi:hypothetical protein
MNKFGKLSLGIIGAFALVQLGACNKIFDHIVNGGDVAKKCRITSFTQNNVPIGPGSRTAQFYYNKHGNIDSIIADVETGSFGAHRFYFNYGPNHKLISYVEAMGPSYPYEEIHKYAYENGRIVRDSLRMEPGAMSTTVKSLEYDNWGRIIKESYKIVDDADGTVTIGNTLTFTYDAQGNLEYESATYDDKVNFLRTNEYLMFTQRDYSVNNRTGATAYNDRGLPLGFAGEIRPTYGPSSLLSFGLPVQITYDCKK